MIDYTDEYRAERQAREARAAAALLDAAEDADGTMILLSSAIGIMGDNMEIEDVIVLLPDGWRWNEDERLFEVAS